jgi:FkbM family methyltransferase
MMIISFLARILRGGLDRAGYVLWKREFFRYGISPFVDIVRLNRSWGRSVETFFDVGANVGQTSREALRSFPRARVFAFEPHPLTFARLRAALPSDRLSVHQLAFGEESGDVKLYVYGTSADGSTMNSLVPDARYAVKSGQSATECIVECSTIDQFCASNDIEVIDVLKIDTEGFDLFVMKGAARMLRERRIGFVYSEFNDVQPRPGTTGGSLLAISDYLEPFGFRYVATYTDFILPDGDMFVCANALFVRPGELRGQAPDKKTSTDHPRWHRQRGTP